MSRGAGRIAVVVLSQGNRPHELSRCLDSALAQTGVELDVLLVGNGWTPPTPLGRGVRTLALPQNVGPAAGRNAGVRESTAELVFFLDDDAWLDDPGVLRRVSDLFAERPTLGGLQLRVRDEDGTTLRRWVPRVRVGDPARSGPAFALCEGVTMVRREAFEQVGGWPAAFFFGHEGIDLAWRMWDAGWELHYSGDLVARHPATPATRHAQFYRLNARNRVWVTRRNLPILPGAAYLAVWTVTSMARLIRRPAAARVWLRGFAEGWRTDPGARRPMRWRTIGKLARLGQPPII
ncbi:MAG: glycosyltransferase [Actinomycetota bacterium]|nr:glycosyltransferase [Actinomycetota bacterium]